MWGNRKIYLEGIFLPGGGSKEYEIRTKMEQEQWLQLKMLFLLGYNLKIVIWCKLGWGWGSNFLTAGGGTPSKEGESYKYLGILEADQFLEEEMKLNVSK